MLLQLTIKLLLNEIFLSLSKLLEVPLTAISRIIKLIQSNYATIKQAGLKATRLNGYSMEDVGKIVLGIDSVIGLELKQKVFGEVEELPDIDWQKALPKVFAGFNLQQNYVVEKGCD